MKALLEYKFFEVGGYALSVYSLVVIALIFLGAKAFIGFFQRFLARIAQRRSMDKGRQQSISLLFRYVVWVAAVAMMLGSAGFDLTPVLLGSSALLVGLGLGLQQIFSDIVSGIFLLFEGTIEIGDILEVDGMVGRIEEISLRTSVFRNLDRQAIIIPNHKFIHEKVVNWTHRDADNCRFQITVGVDYQSDVELVRRLLVECALAHPEAITDDPERRPFARIMGFGNSSLDFELLFYSRNLFGIENTKSDLRFAIWHAFQEHGIEIPYPQQEVTFRGLENLRST